MVLTPSVMTVIGGMAPDFNLPDVLTGKSKTLASLKGDKGTLVMFICRHCPYLQHIKKELGRLGLEYPVKGIAVVGISSNDAAGYPDDRPESLKAFAKEEGYTFPFLYDESQKVAQAYKAACTPDFFLYDTNLKLAYRGQLDDSRPGNGKPVTGVDLRGAMDALAAGQKPPVNQKPSIGCNIKWKPGNEPNYFK
jgi:peroxiredoxin